MEANKKAQDLIGKFYDGLDDVLEPYPIEHIKAAKDCALIALDEIIEEVRDYCDYNHHQDRMNFWIDVKEEINKF